MIGFLLWFLLWGQDISAWMAGSGAKVSMSLSERARRLEELRQSSSEVERGMAGTVRWKHQEMVSSWDDLS